MIRSTRKGKNQRPVVRSTKHFDPVESHKRNFEHQSENDYSDLAIRMYQNMNSKALLY